MADSKQKSERAQLAGAETILQRGQTNAALTKHTITITPEGDKCPDSYPPLQLFWQLDCPQRQKK